MTNLAKTLVGLSAAAFILAVVTNFTVAIFATAEGWASASTNLALIAIALVLCFRTEPTPGR